jgi:DNA ligase-1
MKPMLASDYDELKLRFPLIVQPKIDGVRALNIGGRFTGRSLKGFKNRHVTTLLSRMELQGFDGELAAQAETHPDLCRITSSAVGTIEGEPFVLWWLFDYIHPDMNDWSYKDRLAALRARFYELQKQAPHLHQHLRLMPSAEVSSLQALLDMDAMFLEAGYEGTIVRDPLGKHKQGRSTVREGGLLRIKRFVDFEFLVDEIIEGEENQNAATINALGQTERSTHQENMVANGMIGAMLGRTLGVVKDLDGKVLFEAGQQVRVGAGCLSHDQRRYYFKHQVEFKQQIHKAKFFPKGIKDKPRFPTWQSFRAPEDMS